MKKCIYCPTKKPKWSHIAQCDQMKEITKAKREKVIESLQQIDHNMNINQIFRDYNFLKAQERSQDTYQRQVLRKLKRNEGT